MRKLSFVRFDVGKIVFLVIFLCSFLGLNLTVKAQYDTYFLSVDPYANNGCVNYYDSPAVHQVKDFIGVTPPTTAVLATFTGGRKAGSYFQPCKGMVGYVTSHKDKNGSVTTLPNKINVNFNKAVKFKRIDIDGKYPQRVRVTIDGGKFVEVDLDDETPGDGFGHKAVFVYDIFGTATPRRFSNITVSSDDPDWSFGVYSIDYFDPTPRDAPPQPPVYCTANPIARPAPQNLSGFDWTMRAEVSDDDGLTLTDVRLKGRLMAEKISIPYYRIETSTLSPTRGELRPGDPGGPMRSRLVWYQTEVNDERLIVTATYAIDNISESQSCLIITQRYEFLKQDLYAPCEPGESFPCNQWRALVNYKFTGNNGETLKSLNVAQRSRFTANEFSRNSVGLFRDCDSIPECLLGGALIFKDKINPLYTEFNSQVIAGGQDTHQWDNIHQTYQGDVSEPLENLPPPNFVLGGCPECIHSHWRWGKNQGEHFNNGKLFLPANSTQDLSFAIVRNNTGEDDPTDVADLINNEAVRFPLSPNAYVVDQYQAYRYFVPGEVVTWMSATGYKDSDEFFGFYSFFNSASPNITRSVVRNSLAAASAPGKKENNTSSLLDDGPTSVTYAHLYVDGAATFTDVAPTAVAPLPPGYTAYTSAGYDIRTEAEVSGPHTVTFSVPSVADLATFNSLRILHSEPDPFDSSQAVWVDRTVMSPDTPVPDFAARNISAKANHLGPFLITVYTPPPPNTNTADLSVTSVDSVDPISAGNQLTYTVNVANNGSDAATGVILNDGLSPDVLFVSATPGQGTCRQEIGTIICKLGTIAAGGSVAVTVVVEPTEGQSRFPSGGKTIVNSVFTRADESDSDLNNNTATESTVVLPNPAAPPTVEIQTPASETIMTGPATLNAVIKAFNIGANLISQVELFQDGQSIGSCGALAPGSAYCSISLNNPSFGQHSLFAVATNDGGRRAVSEPVNFIVNGPAVVSLDSPADNAVFGRPGNIALTATATNSAGTISQVEFLADGVPIGNGVLSGTNQYNFTWSDVPSGAHSIRAVATDGNGVKSYSYATKISVTNAPFVSIDSPASGASYPKHSNVAFNISARDFDGYVSKVDLYADGTTQLGTATLAQGDVYTFSWDDVPAGTRSITAVATDNSGLTSVSPPVNIIVTNAAPTVSMTGPSGGSTFTAPAGITLSADAADTDGSVVQVAFYRGTTLIGTVNSSPYNLAWNNVAAGSYTLTAKATDDDGTVTTSSPVSITVNSAGTALFVVGSTTLSSVDSAIKTRLENLGLTVTVKSATASTSADATGKRVVVISDSVTPTDVNTKFRTVTVPVVTLDPQLFDDMGMTATSSTNFGTATTQKNVTITNAAHPMAAGLTGTVQVTSANTTFGWGKINANGIKIATLTTDSTKATDFGYEANAVMPGLTAPKRRVGFFYTASSATLTTNGGLLFDAAVKWAAGL